MRFSNPVRSSVGIVRSRTKAMEFSLVRSSAVIFIQFS
jgi:hypothetical protein